MNTLLTMEQQEELVSKGLAKKKVNGNLVTYKYAKKVMYDYLWNQHPNVMECRGHTYDLTTGKLVIAAPRKSFNYLENGWWSDVELDTPVVLYKKYNGFMCTVAMYQGKPVFASTGTTDSDYVKMAREMFLSDDEIAEYTKEGATYLYEIIHSDDPHIVHEEIGAKYLGYRDHDTGNFHPFNNDSESGFGIYVTLGEAIEILNEVRHEGFMCYREYDMSQVCKLKSPYYIGKKKLMRANKNLVEQMYDFPRSFELKNLPETWWGIPLTITNTIDKELWLSYTDQQRRAVIEDIEARILIGG